MDALLSRHLPIITNRLEFFSQNIGSPPIITSTIDFANRLANKEQNVTTEDSDLSSLSDDNCSDNNDDSNVMDTTAIAPATPPADVDSNSEGEEIADFLDTVDKKISKPRGQPGHPRCGGYSLDFVLRNWGSTLIADVNVNNQNF